MFYCFFILLFLCISFHLNLFFNILIYCFGGEGSSFFLDLIYIFYSISCSCFIVFLYSFFFFMYLFSFKSFIQYPVLVLLSITLPACKFLSFSCFMSAIKITRGFSTSRIVGWEWSHLYNSGTSSNKCGSGHRKLRVCVVKNLDCIGAYITFPNLFQVPRAKELVFLLLAYNCTL